MWIYRDVAISWVFAFLIKIVINGGGGDGKRE